MEKFSFEDLECWHAQVLLTRPGGVVVSVHAAPVTSSTIVVAVDVGKTSAMLLATDETRKRVLGPVEFAMTRSGLSATVHRVNAVVAASARVKVGVEAAGHYHRPVLDYRWTPGWEVLEFNPAHVAEQRRVAGRRRVKTDVIDLEAITELALAGRGRPIAEHEVLIGELEACDALVIGTPMPLAIVVWLSVPNSVSG